MIDSVLIAHLLGDYVLQNDKMAKKKKESHFWCMVHVVWYLVAFIVICDLTPTQLFLIGMQHFFQDRYNFVRWSMVKSSKTEFVENLGPWSIIVVDNIYHLTWIYIVQKIWVTFSIPI